MRNKIYKIFNDDKVDSLPWIFLLVCMIGGIPNISTFFKAFLSVH